MRTFTCLLFSTGFAFASVAAGYMAIDFIEMGLAASGNKGVILCGIAGLYALGTVVNAVAFYRSLPR